MPIVLIAKADCQRLRYARGKQLVQRWLIVLLEQLDRSDVGAEEVEIPFRRIETGERNPRVVLHNHLTVIENEISHPAKATLKHQIRGRLQKAGSDAEVVTELHEPGFRADASVGNVGREIVKSLGPSAALVLIVNSDPRSTAAARPTLVHGPSLV